MSNTDNQKDDIALINIGKNLKHFRTLLKLSQEEAASKSKISVKHYQNIENRNLIAPSLKSIAKICIGLNIPFEFLVKDNGYKVFNDYRNSTMLEFISNVPSEQYELLTETIGTLYDFLQSKSDDIE